MAQPTENQQKQKEPQERPVNGGAKRMHLVPMSSTLLDRSRFASQTGFTFQDPLSGNFRRDVYSALGYPNVVTLKQYVGRYKRGGVANRIINAYPNATWGGGGAIVEDPDPKVTTPFEQAVDDLFTRLDVWNRFRRADVLAGLGHYSVILIGVDGDLNTELPRLSSQEGVFYLTPRGEEKAQISKFDGDPTSPRFGLPDEYQITLGRGRATSGDNNTAGGTKTVHWSRVLHIVENALEDDVFGQPRLRPVWNYLEDLDKLVGGGSEAAWKRMDPGMHIDIPFLGPNGVPLEIPETVMTDIEDEVEEFQHGMRRTIRTRGVDLEQMQAAVANFGANSDTIMKLVSATTGIPFRILTGSERGQLASTSDDNNWNDRVSERRQGFAEPNVRNFIDELVDRGGLPKPGADGYKVIWPEGDEMSESEKAEVAAKLASANSSQATAGDGIIISSDEIRETVFALEPRDDAFGEEELDDPLPGEEPVADTEGEEEELVAAADFVNDEPTSIEWQAVHAAADASRPTFEAAVLENWELAGEAIPQDDLVESLEERDIEATMALVTASLREAEDGLIGDLSQGLHTVLVAGANAVATAIDKRGSWTAAGIVADFDATNPASIQWADRRAGELIAETSPETIQGIRQLIVSGFEEGIPPRRLARAIRSRIGLLERQVVAVQNLVIELETAEVGDLITRFPPRPGVRKNPGFQVRIPEGGLSQRDLNRRVAQYSNMQLNLRARTIARTETMNAANAGQRQLWQQNQVAGNLGQDAQREWIVTPDDRLRDDHADREGVTVGVDEGWPWGSEPGEEPNCRCAQGIASTGRGR